MIEFTDIQKIRFKASAAIFSLGYKEYNHGVTAREGKLPKGWVASPERETRMIKPQRLQNAVYFFDICLELWPDLTGEDGNARTALNLKAVTLRTMGKFQEAKMAHEQVLLAAIEANDKPMQKVSEEGVKYCEEYISKL